VAARELRRSMTSRVRSTLARLLVVALVATACGYDGTPGPGNGAPAGGVEPTLTTVQVGWGAATGPVAGYLVLLARDDAGFEPYAEVVDPLVAVEGEAGHAVRVAVAAFDAHGNYGPISPVSDRIVFQINGAMAVPEPAPTVVAKTLPAGSPTAAAGAASSVPAADGGDTAPQVARRFDFDGDATADLLWESPELGFFRITDFQGETLALFGRAGAGWDRVGLADFDGDGLSDVLWSDAAGELAFTSTAESLLDVPAVRLTSLFGLRSDERVAATGDFDGDGRADVVVADDARGEHTLWLTRAGADSQAMPLPAVEWGLHLADTGDFDGDGRADLLWAGSDGLVVWMMDGAQVRERMDLGESAEMIASGDFDGDGIEDIAHREPAGGVAILRMGVPGGVWNGLPSATPDLVPVGAGDFDGDGLSDLLWRRDGTVEIWFSEGDGRVEPVVVAALGPEWALVGGGGS
jgi:hypothetical protein